MENLYLPVLEAAFDRPARGLVVCKVVTGETPKAEIYSTLDSAEAAALLGRRAVLHWLGANLGPLQPSRLSGHLALARAVA